MTETAAARPLKPVPGPDADGKDGDGGQLAGRMLDIAGIAAGVVLAVIVADILSGGKVTRWLLRRKDQPCDGCGDGGQAAEVVSDVDS